MGPGARRPCTDCLAAGDAAGPQKRWLRQALCKAAAQPMPSRVRSTAVSQMRVCNASAARMQTFTHRQWLQSRTSAPMKIDFDQFNTTVYGYDDRFRGIHGTRMVVLIHRNDMARFSLNVRDVVTLSTAVDDGGQRGVRSDGGAATSPRARRGVPGRQSIPMRVLDQNHRRKQRCLTNGACRATFASLRNVASDVFRAAHSGEISPDDYVGSSVPGRSLVDQNRGLGHSAALGACVVASELSARTAMPPPGLWRDVTPPARTGNRAVDQVAKPRDACSPHASASLAHRGSRLGDTRRSRA